jgi:TonB family protein
MRESRNIIKEWLRRFTGPPTQASLFNYIKNEPEESIWKGMDWNFLLHPIRTAKDAWERPRAKPSLFHYVDAEPQEPFSLKEFIRDLFSGARNPFFVPSVFSDPDSLMAEQVKGRSRKMELFFLILVAYILAVPLAIFLTSQLRQSPVPEDNVVFINNPIFVPFEGDGLEGGGGGGGGRNEQAPPASGRMPEPSPSEMIAPDPENPQPLVPADDLLAEVRVEMPIDIPQDLSLPIGDVFAPPNNSTSAGPGSGGGIGTGRGSGVGSGTGAGVGPGSGGGMGGGSGGGIGSGVGPYVMGNLEKDPQALRKPLPPYTEEARKMRVEGIVLLQAIIRKDGSVDSFKVIRGLGYGLDESAIRTIASKWRFQPGMYKGKPVDVLTNIEVTFRIY